MLDSLRRLAGLAVAWIPSCVAILAGAATALQVVVNSQARMRLEMQSPLQATLLNFGVGTVVLVAISLVAGWAWPSMAAVAAAPPWIWIGGLLGIFYVSSSVTMGPTLGVTLFLTLVVAGQLAGAMLLDHFGVFGTTPRPANPGRVLGVLLVFAGAVLVAVFTEKTS